MDWLQTITTAALSAVLVGGAAYLLSERHHHRHGLEVGQAAVGGEHGWRSGHRWLAGRGHGGWLCDPAAAARLRTTMTRLAETLALEDRQRPAWDDLDAAVLGAAQDLAPLCEAGATKGVVAMLAAIERGLDGGQAALARIRPALEALYQVLTPPQRAVLDSHLARRHHGHRA